MMAELYVDLEKLREILGLYEMGAEWLDNPSFEDGLKGWIVEGSGTHEIIEGRMSGKALRMIPDPNNVRDLMCERLFPATPRQYIYWTFWARMPATGAIQGFVQFYDSKKAPTMRAFPCPIQKHPEVRYHNVLYAPISDWTAILSWYSPDLDQVGFYTVNYPSTGAAYFRIGVRAWNPPEGGGYVDLDDFHMWGNYVPRLNPDHSMFVRKGCMSGGKYLWVDKNVGAGEATESLWVEEFEGMTALIKVDAPTTIYVEFSLDEQFWVRKSEPLKVFTSAGEDVVDVPVKAGIFIRFVSESATKITLVVQLKG
jgi:hypothetical protein